MTIPTEELLAHRAFVDRLARDLAVDQERASDLSQETWVRMLERGPRSAAALRAWLACVAPRLAQRRAEREASRSARERDVARPEALAPPAELAAGLADRRAVLAAVQGLREPYRSAVLLRYYEGLSPAAIAERQGQTVGTVKTRLKRALRELRANLGRAGGVGSRLGFAPQPCFPDPPRAGGTAAPLGGLIVGTKLAVGAVAGAALLAGLMLFLRDGDEAPRAGGVSVAEQPREPQAPAGGPSELVQSAVAEAGIPLAEPDRRSASAAAAEPAAAEAELAHIPVPATAALVLRGHVFHRHGPPAPGATVILGLARAQTDEQGAFALSLEQDGMDGIPPNVQLVGSSIDPDAPLVAVLDGFGPAVLEGFGAVAEERARGGEEVELVLPGAAGTIAGFLIDQRGAPAAGWRIKVLDGTIIARTVLFPVSAESLAAEPGAVVQLGADAIGPASALAGFQYVGDEGRFRFGGLSIDRAYRLRAWNSGTLESVESEPLAPGTEGYVLQVPGTPPRALVDGVVVGTDGAPLAGVRCRLSMVEHEAGGTTAQKWLTTGQELTTALDGRFAFRDVPHGALFVRFDVEGDGAELTLEPGSEYRDVRVVLERAGSFSFESIDPGSAPDHVAVEDGTGQRLRIAYTLERGRTAGTLELPVSSGVSPVGLVHESARFLVLFKDGAEVGRAELLVRPGEVTLVRR